ncbi:signal peptide-containing protein [Cryptosporidium canis]|uniref:Signal peptide-containing protein n=1 Tax=Cryptosporidium canis TaxID=195482 RepID=A0ABQ8PAL7_9CRYT|nr:signal peptide-containing protein [Cryptosporidium canis]
MKTFKWYIYPRLRLLLILAIFLSKQTEYTSASSRNGGEPIISRPSITTRSSSEGLGRTYDKGVEDTLSVLEQYYDGTDNWRHYNVVNQSMKDYKPEDASSEQSDVADGVQDIGSSGPTEQGKPEISAVAQTPADYKFPDAVIPLTKNKVLPTQVKDPKFKDTEENAPSIDKGEMGDDMSEDQTEVIGASEEQGEGTEYEYAGESEGFGPSDIGYEAISEQYDPNMESYSYHDGGMEPEDKFDYSYKLESEPDYTDPGVSYLVADENADDGGQSYIYRGEDGSSQTYPGSEREYVDGHDDEESIRYISEHGSEQDYEERYISEGGDGHSETENVYVDETDSSGTEYEYTGEGADESEASVASEEGDGKASKKKRRSRRHTKKPKLPKRWESWTEEEKQDWLERHPRTKKVIDRLFGENKLTGRQPRRSRRRGELESLDRESALLGRGGRRRGGVLEDEDEDSALVGRGRRGRRHRGEEFDDDLGWSRSSPRRRRRRDRLERSDLPGLKNRRGRRRGYDLIQDIKGDPYLTTVGERVLSKYPMHKRDNILKLRDNILRDIKRGRRPSGIFEDIMDPVDLMLIYRDANKMPLLTVRNEGDIPLEYLLKLPKGTYRWEELDPQERARLRKKWKEEIVNGTFWDDDKLHGDWSDEVRLLGEWGEEEALRGIMGREMRPENKMGEEYSYYSFEPKFTDLRNMGVFSGEYPEDIEHLMLVGDMLPEDKLEGDFRVPELQLLRFHPRFGNLEELDDDFALENIQSRRNEGSFYLPKHKPSWMEYRTRGSFGKGTPEDKFTWLESLDRDDALKLIEEANYGDPYFNEKLILKYPWLRDRIGESVYSDDGLILPIQVLNEFIPRSVYDLAKEDERYPGSRWYFSEVPSDRNLDRFITDIYEHMEPSSIYRRHRGAPHLDMALENLLEEEFNPNGWDRETINYLRELFRDAENREIELQNELDGLDSPHRRGSVSSRNGRRKHRLMSSRPDMPIWYFGTDEQRDRERRLEFAIESDSTGGIIEARPSNRIFLDSTGRRPDGLLGLELQDISEDPGYDVESMGVSGADYYLDPDDDDDDLNLEMMGSYPSSRALPRRINNLYPDEVPGFKHSSVHSGIYPVDSLGRSFRRHKGRGQGFSPRTRYIFSDDDIDLHSPLSISQSEFLQESSGFNMGNPFLLGRNPGSIRDGLNRLARPERISKRRNLGASKRYPASHKVNEFGQEDPMEIMRDYFNLNENSILDVFDGKGIYRPQKKKVGFGVGDLDYLRRSNDDDWNYLKKLKEGRSAGPRSKGKEKPLWYYYDSIGRRWDDSLMDEDDLMDSSIDLVVKEIQSKRGNKSGRPSKGAKHKHAGKMARRGGRHDQDGSESDEEDYSLAELGRLSGKSKSKGRRRRGSKKRKGKDGNKSIKRKDKKVRFKLHQGDDGSEASKSSSEVSSAEVDSSQEETPSLDRDFEVSGQPELDHEDEDEELDLGSLAKRILMGVGYDDDLDPNVPLTIESEMLDLLDTGKRSRGKGKGKGKDKHKKGKSSANGALEDSLDDMRDAKKKIRLDRHDLSEIRRLRRDLDDESGDLEALKALIKKLRLGDFINLSDDSSLEEQSNPDSLPEELERSDDESSTSASGSNEEAPQGDQHLKDLEDKKSALKPLKIVRVKKSKKSSGGESVDASTSESASGENTSDMDTSQVEEEEFDLSEWDNFINEELSNLESKPSRSKSGKASSKSKRIDSRRKKGLRKSKEEKEALLSLGIDPKAIKRINLLLKDKNDGVKNALEYLLDELENNLEDGPESKSKGKKSRRKRSKRRGSSTRRPYDLEPVTPPFSRYILKLKDVLGPKEALEELLDNLNLDLSGEESIPKELRRYITPSVLNEVRVLRNKKNGDERALNKLLNVLKIPNKRSKRQGGSKDSEKRGGRRLPALLSEEDIKAVNRLLKRNKAPQALEYFLRSTDLDKDLDSNNQGVYRPRSSYSGLNLSPDKLSKIKYLMDQGPQGCRDALSEIFDDLGIPKQRNLFDGSLASLDQMEPHRRRNANRSRQRRMAMLPNSRDLESGYSEMEDGLDGDVVDGEFSEFDDFSTFIPRDYFRLNRGGNISMDPRGMIPLLGHSGIPDSYKVSPASMLAPPSEGSHYSRYMEDPVFRSGLVPSPRYYKAPEMSRYDRDLRDFVNKRRKGFGMPNIPDYQYWNYDPEMTGRSVYEGLDTPTNRRRKQILDKKRKLGNYLDEEHDVSVPLDDEGSGSFGRPGQSKTTIMKSYVDDDLPETSEEVMLVHKPEYTEEELYDMGQCIANGVNAAQQGVINSAEKGGTSREVGDLNSLADGFEVEREATREEILSALVTDPKMETSSKLILREISDDDDSVANKLRNMIVENPMMERSNVPGPVDSVEKLREMQKQAPESREIKSFGYIDPSLSSYDKKLYSDAFVESLEKGGLDASPVSISSQMFEECSDMASQLKMKELGCEKIAGDSEESRKRPLDVRRFSKRVSKVKNLYAKSFMKQISFPGEVAKLFIEKFSDLKGWNKAMDRHRWVALPLTAPQSYVPNLGGLNLFQRMVLHQAVKKQSRHSPRRVLILAFSTRLVQEKKLPSSLANLGDFSGKKSSVTSVEYSMNVEYNQGMLVIPLIELALCVKGGLQLNNVLDTNKSKKTRVGTCIVGGVRSQTAAQKIYRAALKYLEMSPDLSMAKFLIIPIKVGRENLSEQLKLSESGNTEKNFGLQIPEDAISPAVSDLEFSKLQFEMKFENSKQVKERYNKKLASLSESIFKLYLKNSRELDIRSLKANGPRSVVIPMSFPQLYIKGYSRAQKLVKSIQNKFKPSLKNRSNRNKLKPGFILLINDHTVNSGLNSKQFVNDQIKRIQSFFTNPYSFKNFKSRKHEGPVLEIKGVNSLQLRKFLLDAIARASRQPSVVPMIILPIFVDNNSRTSKSDKRAMDKTAKKNAKHSNNI